MTNRIVCAGHQLPDHAGVPFGEQPRNPRMLEGTNVWFFEENGEFGVPRIALDAFGDNWDKRWTGANFVLPDGRVADGRGSGYPPVPTLGQDGKPKVFGCSVMQFECIEPYKKWQLSYEDEVLAGDVADRISLAENPAHTPVHPQSKVRLKIDAKLHMSTPPWGQVYPEDAPDIMKFLGIGGWRYEIPCIVEGSFKIDGKARHFKGPGNFVHRQNLRTLPHELPGWNGHVWQAAIFPDGRAFALNVYPKKEGVYDFNMAYLYKGGKVHEARVVQAPWLKGSLQAKGEDVSVVLESALGRTTIKGTTLLSTFHPMAGMRLHQGGARYTWDDQTAIGMIERSL